MKSSIALAFVLLLALMFLVYYQGLIADAGAVGTLVQTSSYALTGRKTDGTFAGYPSGATTATKA